MLLQSNTRRVENGRGCGQLRALHDYHVLFTWGRGNCILFSRNYGSGTELNDFEDIMVGNSAKKKMLLNQEKHKNNRSRTHKNNIDSKGIDRPLVAS